MNKKMELTLESCGTWYGQEIKEEVFKNAVWRFLNDLQYTKEQLEQMVNKSLESGEGFNIELTFKSGAGESKSKLIMQEYKG
jgi:hypothetical protein